MYHLCRKTIKKFPQAPSATNLSLPRVDGLRKSVRVSLLFTGGKALSLTVSFAKTPLLQRGQRMGTEALSITLLVTHNERLQALRKTISPVKVDGLGQSSRVLLPPMGAKDSSSIVPIAKTLLLL